MIHKCSFNVLRQRLSQSWHNIQQQHILIRRELSLTAQGSTKKKDTHGQLPRTPVPDYVEAGWYQWWQSQGLFSPEYTDGKTTTRNPFVMCLPPPNVTGTLHLGHALGNSIQDTLARWHRMNGDQVLWLPGCDHAGIATQVVVEKQLYRDRGLTRHDLGRQQFISHVWQWKQEKCGVIYDQMKQLGLSLDWDRETFTLDEKLSDAVCEAFIHLHDEGLIYRKQKLVNWCCALNSAISDIEVDNLEIYGKTYVSVPGYSEKVAFGQLWTIEYQTETGRSVYVATTRPETMLGDVAVAIHPNDARYSHLHGTRIIHPLTGEKQKILLDESINIEFGTGVAKLTPGHDQTDYDIANRHGLEIRNMLNDNGTTTHNLSDMEQYQGLPRFEAREKILVALTDRHKVKSVQEHNMVLPICSRTGDIIEPLLKEQWFVNCNDMAKQAIQVVKSGDLKLEPEHYEKQWCDWLENIRDWCISRQLWWGHRIPAYRVITKQDGTELGWVSARSEEEALDKACRQYDATADDLTLSQDEDVLDTWFSSALLPFSVFGWPSPTSDLASFYPTNLLVTASDIMFFWVARMVMMAGKLTGQLPFNTVLFHSILRDSSGRKMSKSLGNVIDPIDVIHGISLQDLQKKLEGSNLSIEEIKRAGKTQCGEYPQGIPACGADALRFTLVSYNYKSNYINMDVNHVVQNYQFCNKIWQSFRYIVSKLPENFIPQTIQPETLAPLDQWLLSRLSTVVSECHNGFTDHELYKVTGILKDFWWHDVCDLYLEYSKLVLSSTTDPTAVYQLLHYTLTTYLQCMAPFMPFLCEELYQRLPGVDVSSVCVQPYPSPQQFMWRNDTVEDEVSIARRLITELRALQHEFLVSDAKVYIQSKDAAVSSSLKIHHILIEKLSQCECITREEPPPNGCVRRYYDDYTLHLHLQGSIDCEKELGRIQTQITKLTKSVEKLMKKTGAGVPEHIILDAEQQIQNTNEKLMKLQETIQILQEGPDR